MVVVMDPAGVITAFLRAGPGGLGHERPVEASPHNPQEGDRYYEAYLADKKASRARGGRVGAALQEGGGPRGAGITVPSSDAGLRVLSEL